MSSQLLIGHSLNTSLAAAAILTMAALADTAFSAQSPPGPGGGKAPSTFHIHTHNLQRPRVRTPNYSVATLCSQYAHAFRGRRQRRRAPAIEAGGGQSRKERPSSRRRSRVQQHSTTAQCDQSIGCCSDNKNTASAAAVIASRPRQDLWPQFNLRET